MARRLQVPGVARVRPPLRRKATARPVLPAGGRAPTSPSRPPARRVPGWRCPRRRGGAPTARAGSQPQGSPPHLGAAERRLGAPDQGSPSGRTPGGPRPPSARNSAAGVFIFSLPVDIFIFFFFSRGPLKRTYHVLLLNIHADLLSPSAKLEQRVQGWRRSCPPTSVSGCPLGYFSFQAH
ncbi:uncharacterized protein LOC128929155 [Callithrix jacchus]